MTAMPPSISVVVPAHNAGPWIRDCIDSLLAQTVSEIEIIVVNDASTDDTAAAVRAVGDPRVKLVENERNMGVSMSRNRGIELATGEYLAFMDADDLALPSRFEKQLSFLRSRPEVTLCGGWMQTFGRRDDVWPTKERHDDIKAELLYACGVLQSTVFCRRECFLRHGLKYDSGVAMSEDYELWTRCADVMRLGNLSEVLVLYRTHDANASLKKRERLVAIDRMLRMRQLQKLGISPTAAEAELHTRLFEYGPTGPGILEFDLDLVESWLLRLRAANRDSGYVSERALDIVLYEFWRRCCRQPKGGFRTARFLRSRVLDGTPPVRRLKDAAKGMLGLTHYPLPRT